MNKQKEWLFYQREWNSKKEPNRNLKQNQTELKNSINEMKNSLECIGNRADHMEEKLCKLEDKYIEIRQVEEERGLRFLKSEKNPWELTLTTKANIRIMGTPQEEERKKGTESVFKEIITECFPHLEKKWYIQVHKVNATSYYLSTRRPSQRHIVLKLSKVSNKDCNSRQREKKMVTYKGTPMRLSADFLAEFLWARRKWDDIFKILKEKNC